MSDFCNHQAPLSMGFPRQEYWTGLPFSSSGDLPDPGTEPPSPVVAGRFFTRQKLLQPNSFLEPPRKPIYMYMNTYIPSCIVHSLLCLTFCDPMDYSPPGSSFHRISQARILEWVAICYSRRPSSPWDQTHISCASCIGRWIHHCATWEAMLPVDYL